MESNALLLTVSYILVCFVGLDEMMLLRGK